MVNKKDKYNPNVRVHLSGSHVSILGSKSGMEVGMISDCDGGKTFNYRNTI